MEKAISSSNAPAAVGPYSRGILAGNLLLVSGQPPKDALVEIGAVVCV